MTTPTPQEQEPSANSPEAPKSLAEKVSAAIKEARATGVSGYFGGTDAMLWAPEEEKLLHAAREIAEETAEAISVETGASYDQVKGFGLGELDGELFPVTAGFPGDILGFVVGKEWGKIEVSRNKKDYVAYNVHPGSVILVAATEGLDGTWMRGQTHKGKSLYGYWITSDEHGQEANPTPYSREARKLEAKRRRRTSALARRAMK